MASSRPLLVPHKRPLQSSANKKSIAKVINPSAVAAETRMKPSLATDDDEGAPGYQESRPARFELSFAMPPQQFLDPPIWEAMVKKHKEAQSEAKESAGSSHSDDQDFETADQRRQREEREAEYGSMAIRSRSSVRGRGKRGKRGKGAGRIH